MLCIFNITFLVDKSGDKFYYVIFVNLIFKSNYDCYCRHVIINTIQITLVVNKLNIIFMRITILKNIVIKVKTILFLHSLQLNFASLTLRPGF